MVTGKKWGGERKENGKTILACYNTLHHASKNGKVLITAVGNTRSIWVGYVLDTHNQQSKCGNTACGNQSLAIKDCPQDCP